MEITKVWQQALNSLRSKVTAVSFDLWINTLEPIDFVEGTFILSTTSESAKNRVLELHSTQIRLALKEASDQVVDLKVLDPFEKDEYIKENEKQATEEPGDETNKSKFNKKYTFNNFVVGSSNKYVYAACEGVAKNPFKINPLFIYGGSGLGKTHLLHAIGNYITEHSPSLKIIYVTCERFTNDYIESLKTHKESAFREKYRNLDILMIDDIQFISTRIQTQEAFFHTFNDLYENNKQIIIASDRPPRELSMLQERLVSRFSMGIIQDVQSPDIETRIAILRKKAEDEKYRVSDEVINFIAEKCDSNIREMEGLLSKVHFYASLRQKDVADLEDVQESIKDHVSTNKQNLTTDLIIDCVCKYYSISKADLLGKKKNKDIVEPRQVAMYIIYDMMDLPLASISQVFGKKDHTTVIHARNKITELIKESNRVKTAVTDIKSLAVRQ